MGVARSGDPGEEEGVRGEMSHPAAEDQCKCWISSSGTPARGGEGAWRTSNVHRIAVWALGMGLGMGLGLGNEVIFYRRSSPFESLDVTRTHLEVKRLGKKGEGVVS